MKKFYKSLIKLVFVLILPIASVSLLIYVISGSSEISTLQTVGVTMMTMICIFIAIFVWNISSNVNTQIKPPPTIHGNLLPHLFEKRVGRIVMCPTKGSLNAFQSEYTTNPTVLNVEERPILVS